MWDSKLVYSFDGPAADFLKYSFLVVSVLGLVGNSLSLITVTSKLCKRSSFTVYIGALAVVDSCMLVTNLADTLLLGVKDVDLGHHGAASCKVFKFSQALLRNVSAWLIIAITIERVIATIYPLRFTAIYSTRFGTKLVGTLAGFMTLLNTPLLCVMDYTYIDHGPLCVIKDGPYHSIFIQTVPMIYFFISVILPSFILIAGNTVVVVKVRSSRRLVAPTTSSRQSTNSTSRHLVVIALLISSAFVVCTVPFYVAVAINSFAFDDTNDTQRQAVFSVALTLQNLNFATNFYLYILSGRRCRELFKSAITCNRRGNHAQSAIGKKKSSGRSKKSIKTATTNCRMVSVSVVDQITHGSKRSIHTGSRDKGKATSGFETARGVDQHGNVQPYDATIVTSLQEDTGIQQYGETRVTGLHDDTGI